MTDQCIFCRIVADDLEASVVHETPTTIALMDIDPATPGHVLVMPKAHLPALADLDDDTANDMFAVARAVATALRASSIPCAGVNLFYADGEVAFQEVPHSHLHVVPRTPGDGFTIAARWGSAPPRAELDAQASELRIHVGR